MTFLLPAPPQFLLDLVSGVRISLDFKFSFDFSSASKSWRKNAKQVAEDARRPKDPKKVRTGPVLKMKGFNKPFKTAVVSWAAVAA